MKKVQDSVLQLISAHILNLLRNPDIALEEIVDTSGNREIHGFPSTYIAWEQIEHFAKEYDFEPGDVSVEIFEVRKNLSHKVHTHKNSTAIITLLGEDESYTNPQRSYYMYRSTEPYKAVRGITLNVTPNVIHGFFAIPEDNDGYLAFLSVQSPKIDEDFCLVK